MRRLSLLCCLVLAAGLAGCGENNRPQRLPAVDMVIEREGREAAALRVEVARSEDERAKGLMFRQELPDGEAMLFVFDRDQILSFWMKNTLIPLSIAYIAWDGRILEIHDMRPHNLSPVSSSRSARYALETPQGWFERAGVRPGDVLRLDPVL
jgi:uncharacterized membrane protein (UPF0127 family)